MAKKILLVEDEPDQIAMLKVRLEANGYEFMSAMDGEEGLKKVNEEKPDLVLLDIIMPKMDGIEVCKRLKKDSNTKSIPVIVITAAGIKDAEQKSREVGADDYIKKPYDAADLVLKIKALVDK